MSSEITYNFQALITLLPSKNGGRKKPVYSGYRPSFAFNTSKHYSGEIHLIGTKELFPGETSKVTVKLLPAKTIRKNLKPADAFTITEGDKAVGTGIIEKVQYK